MESISLNALPVDLAVVVSPGDEEQDIYLLSSDVTAGVGPGNADNIKLEAGLVTRFVMRVALLDLLAVGAEPVAVTLTTSLPRSSWKELTTAVQASLTAWDCPQQIPLTGSSEDNFTAVQTTISITILGRVRPDQIRVIGSQPGHNLYLVGTPVSGEEVLDRQDGLVSWREMELLLDDPETVDIIPVGSKGARDRINRLIRLTDLEFISGEHPLAYHSAGPATALVISSGQELQYYQDRIEVPVYQLGSLDKTQ
ncbi:MAG: hypothetical protein ACQEQG_03785 [Bacillota bacterium]